MGTGLLVSSFNVLLMVMNNFELKVKKLSEATKVWGVNPISAGGDKVRLTHRKV